MKGYIKYRGCIGIIKNGNKRKREETENEDILLANYYLLRTCDIYIHLCNTTEMKKKKIK